MMEDYNVVLTSITLIMAIIMIALMTVMLLDAAWDSVIAIRDRFRELLNRNKK